MSQNHDGLLTNQIKQLEKFLLGLIIVITFWLGFTSSSFLLIAQGVLATSLFVDTILKAQLKQNKVFNTKFWKFFWLILASVLVAIFGTLNVVKLQNNLPNPVAGATILIAISSLIAQIILITGIEKRPLKMEFFKHNISWLFVLITSLTIQFSQLYILDSIVAIGILMYLLIINLRSLYKHNSENVSQEVEDKYELEAEVVDNLLEIAKVEKLVDLQVIKIDGEFLITGFLVVSNNCSQENIFEIKTKAKKILVESGFENSVLEIVYLAEFKGN